MTKQEIIDASKYTVGRYCDICGELAYEVDEKYWREAERPFAVCDKCKQAIMAMRKQIEQATILIDETLALNAIRMIKERFPVRFTNKYRVMNYVKEDEGDVFKSVLHRLADIEDIIYREEQDEK